jgi:hypothetical protein
MERDEWRVVLYTVLAAGVTVAVLYAAALWEGVPPRLLTMTLWVPGSIGLFLLFGLDEHSVNAAGTSSVPTRLLPNVHRRAPTMANIPGRYVVGTYLTVLGGGGLVALAVLAVLG